MVDFTPKDTTGNYQFTDNTFIGPRGRKRTLILWEVPHLGGNQRYIEMYINPQSLNIQNRKVITEKRTKGGYIMQYWGEELERISIDGITGDSGIEGLNALMDVYRSEQLSLIAIAKARQQDSDVAKRRQPLAALSASVIMWYQGQGKRGYFNDFSSTESVQNNGTFTYRLAFTVTETIGTRANFMPWHRKPWSTTATPNLGAGGQVVTGGYAGDTSTRIGPLNSPSGRVVTVVANDERNRPVSREQWTENRLKDSKYNLDHFPANSAFVEDLSGFGSPAGTGFNQSSPQEPGEILDNPTAPTGKADTAVNDSNVPSGDASVTPRV